MSQEKRWIDPRFTKLPFERFWPFVELSDGSLLTIDGNATRTSSDNGKTWSEPHSIYLGPSPGIPSSAAVLLKSRDGVLVLVYMDWSTYKWGWDDARREAADDVRLDVWAIRSLDEGVTWVDRQQLLDGYCGALIDIVQADSGQIVVPVQRLLRDPSRNETRVHVSADNGKTWKQSNLIDLGGRGHHGGAYEATLVQLKDGRLWMLLRTNWDRFWEAYSSDGGYSWRVIKPSRIGASTSPGYLARLASGRLVLVWNQLYPAGKTNYPRLGGDGNLSEVAASWQRDELSIAFSQDDGKTWTKPIIIARQTSGHLYQHGESQYEGGSIAYPYLFERKPGLLWIITRLGPPLRVSVEEADLLGDLPASSGKCC